MGKPNTEKTVADNAAPATDNGATTASTAAKKGGSAIMMADGMRRVDYIRQEFAKGRKRGEIAKELGVAYQIVFAATKEVAPKETPASNDASAPAETAAAA